MIRSLLSSLTLPCFLAVAVSTVAAQTPAYHVGDHVVAIRDVGLRVPEGETAQVRPGFVLEVSDLNGNWLWVNSGKSGWIHRGNVVPLARAAERFETMSRRFPGDPRWQYAKALVAHESGNTAAAITVLSPLIRRYPRDVSYLLSRGFALYDQGEPQAAVADFSKAIEIDDENTKALNNRANVYVALAEYDKAIADLDRAIELDEKNLTAFNSRGHAHEMQGKYTEARDDYQQAIQLGPKFALAFNNLAWLVATCPDESVRNGKLAVSHAKTACELTKYKNPLFVSTLAAAHAEQGEFDEAVKQQQEANELAEDRLPEEFTLRLKAFQQQQPYRKSPVETR